MGAVDEWTEIIELVTVHCDVSRPCIVMRRLDDADHAPLRQLFRRDVRPVLSAIGGKVHQTIISADPQHVFLYRRFRGGKDGVVILNAGNVEGNGTAGGLLFGLVVACEIRTDGSPALSAVGGLK